MTTAAQRDQAIKDLQAALAAETSARKAADDALATKVGMLESESDAYAGKLLDHEMRISALEAPVVVPPPIDPPPPAGKVANVSTIPALLAAVADNTNDEVVLRNGSYTLQAAGFGYTNDADLTANRLWIGSSHRRTRPVLVRPETPYGVILSSSGGHLSFMNGACNQTWDGFVLANAAISQTGSVTFGGWPIPGAHHITLRHFKVLASVTGSTAANDHGIYISSSNDGGPHDLVFEDWDFDQTSANPLSSAYHHDHDPNAYNVRAERFAVRGTRTAVFFYADSKHDITLRDWTIDGARSVGVDYSHPSPNILLDNVQVTNTPTKLYAPNGTAGLTRVGCNF